MCGRFTLQNPSDVLADLFGIKDPPDLQPRYNIAPTQPVLGIRDPSEADGREFAFFRWGLIPFFARDTKMAARMINARSETVATKPSFRAAFKRRRCLIPADGFFEWRKEGNGKQPFHIVMGEGQVFAMAGLFESWQAPDGERIESCTVLTTEPNREMAPIHDRMPVILDAEDWDLWLDTGIESKSLLDPLLVPWEGTKLRAVAVSRHVNNARNDDPGCIEPAPGS